MAILKFFFITLMIVVTVFIYACAKEGTDGPDKNIVKKPAEFSSVEQPKDGGLTKAIKEGRLTDYKSKTIGKAFDSYKYLIKKEWKATIFKSKHVTVDFIGWFKPETLSDKDINDGITGRGINVKFVIEPDGSYYVFMVLKIESKSDGKVYGYQLQDSAGILANIYANKKIKL